VVPGGSGRRGLAGRRQSGNIRERLERDGYFDAEVEYATSTNEVTLKNGHQGTEEVITYRVERGDRHNLLGIEITGNHYFSIRSAAAAA